MKTLGRAFGFSALLTGSLLLQSVNADVTGAREAPKPKKESAPGKAGGTMASSVWKVTSDKATVYLAGSVHLLRKQDHPLPPSYDLAYEDSKSVIFEVDFAEMNDLKGQQELLKLGSYQDGETVRDHVSEATYEKLQEYFASRGLGGPMFETMKPGMLALTICALEYMRVGAMPYLGVDMVYFNKAKEDGKPTAGLETSEFQMTLFDALSKDQEENLLLKTLDSLEETAGMVDEMVDAWRTGNARNLAKLMRDEFSEEPELEHLLLVKRNRTWIPKIVEMLESGENAMVVVGTGHLVGRKSVVSMLKRKGYQIEQLRVPRGKAKPAPKPSSEAPGEKKEQPAPAATPKAEKAAA